MDEIYVAGTGLYPFLASINNQWQSAVPGWRMRISDKKRRVPVEKSDGKIGYSGHFFVDYFSVDQQSSVSGGKRLSRKRINVINLELFFNKPPTDPEIQLEAVLALFHVADNRKINIRSSNGALGAALLRTMPSYKKEKRHAAPKFINLFSRKYLPGNYYGVSNRLTSKTYADNEGHKDIPFGYYLDQIGSYHQIVKTARVPHPHSIRARGYYKEAMTWGDRNIFWRNWTTTEDSVFEEIMKGKQIGLFLARVHTATLGRYDRHLYPPWAQKPGNRYVWIWTPELRFVMADKRLYLDSFMAGFSGFTSDTAISEYGTWALDYLQANNWTKQYTKGALHAAYGMLAFNSVDRPAIRKYWGGNVRGTKVDLPSAGTVNEREFKLGSTYQTALNNTIAFGIIQSETRTRSLEYGKYLHEQGFHVVQVYVDGIFVETNQMPFIMDGWKIEGQYTNVSIPRPNAFLSDQVKKLPGIHQTEDDDIWLQRREESRRPVSLV